MEHSKIINGSSYLYRNLPAKPALLLLPKVGKIVAPFLARITRPENLKKELAGPAFLSALTDFFVAADEPFLDEVVSKLLAQVEKDGVSIADTWNVAFASDLPTLVKILQFAVTSQYGGFFSALRPTAKDGEAGLPGLPSPSVGTK